MKLQNPPITEVWLEIRFTPNENKETWGENIATKFVEEIQPDFLPKDLAQNESVNIEWDNSGQNLKIKKETKLERIRSSNSDGTRWIQIGDDVLVYNLVRKEGAYPGFGELKKDAFKGLASYCKVFKPQSVSQVALHYVDIIEIPQANLQETQFSIEKFFKIFPTLPVEMLQEVQTFRMDVVLRQDDNPLYISFRRDLPTQEHKFRFRMEWHASVTPIDSLDQIVIEKHLDIAHDNITQCFEKCFTERAWKIFRPEKDS